MINKIAYALLITCLGCSGMAKAQLYTFDKDLVVENINLIAEDSGAKTVVYTRQISDTVFYHTVKGHDVYQLVDVLVSSSNPEVSLNVSLAKDHWDNRVETATTANSPENVVNFKFRDYGEFGVIVESDSDQEVEYLIAVLASPPSQSFLGSPFVTIENTTDSTNNNESASVSIGPEIPSWLYIVLALAFVMIFYLILKLRNQKKTLVLVLLLFTVVGSSLAQRGRQRSVQSYIERVESALQEGGNSSIDNVLGRMATIRAAWADLNTFVGLYEGLTDCVPNTSPPGSPSLPSFCSIDIPVGDGSPLTEEQTAAEDRASDCSSCFTAARLKFNDARYKLEKLRIIYKCSKRYTDAAVKLGDNSSGIHAVTGLVWQQERAEIMKKFINLEHEYDKTYTFLIAELKESMMQLNLCEEQYGVPDWFNRFGLGYFEFMQARYLRD